LLKLSRSKLYMDIKTINNIAIIIPAYDPAQHLTKLLGDLMTAGFHSIIVVDDGSDERSAPMLDAIKQYKNTILLQHEKNQGKGAAIKTGLRYVRENLSDQVIGAVTVDADGQHVLKDIVAVSRGLQKHPSDLSLGEREFGEEIPWRSKFGNLLTQKLFGWIYRQNIKDTQTGLRGIPLQLMDAFLDIPYSGYEFELECLVVAINRGINVYSVDIDTIYIDDNIASHFNPVVDSIKIYYVFFRYVIIAILSFLIDLVVFVFVHSFTQNIIVSLFCARIISGTFNFYQNKYNVYKAKNKQAFKREVASYILLAISIFFGSYVFIYILHQLVGLGVITSKVISDAILFSISFIIQKVWIFKSKAI